MNLKKKLKEKFKMKIILKIKKINWKLLLIKNKKMEKIKRKKFK